MEMVRFKVYMFHMRARLWLNHILSSGCHQSTTKKVNGYILPIKPIKKEVKNMNHFGICVAGKRKFGAVLESQGNM
jgi:hypothetical protein